MTISPIILVDLRSLELSGKLTSETLEQAGITCNKNSVPFDQRSPQETSGIRLGSPALTTRDMKESEFQHIGEMIAQILKELSEGGKSNKVPEVKRQVQDLCRRFPLYN